MHMDFTSTFSPFRGWNIEGCDIVSHISLQLFDWGYISTMMNSFCWDEVSSSLARRGLFKNDGERLVNDELQSCGKPKILAPALAFGLYLLALYHTMRSREIHKLNLRSSLLLLPCYQCSTRKANVSQLGIHVCGSDWNISVAVWSIAMKFCAGVNESYWPMGFHGFSCGTARLNPFTFPNFFDEMSS